MLFAKKFHLEPTKTYRLCIHSWHHHWRIVHLFCFNFLAVSQRSVQNKMKKMVVRISRHPYFDLHVDHLLQENPNRVRKCRVNLERLKMHPKQLKPKHVKVCVCRLPAYFFRERSEISVTPAASIINSEVEEERGSAYIDTE
ncbi:uncharacterized protein HP4 [Drosophila tropicalis]|uniref:uncharacterized protein HP4 n=1 Tax=Drosophila tropicalis TaxID=46794 RepID=UPI0035ABB3D2